MRRLKKGPIKGSKAKAKRKRMTETTHPITSVNFIYPIDNPPQILTVKRSLIYPPMKPSKLLISYIFMHYLTIDVVKGKRAIFLALFMATVSILWCFAQLPLILLGMILPRSVVNIRSDFESL